MGKGRSILGNLIYQIGAVNTGLKRTVSDSVNVVKGFNSKVKKLNDNRMRMEHKYNVISSEDYLKHLNKKLASSKKWSNDYVKILEEIRTVEQKTLQETEKNVNKITQMMVIAGGVFYGMSRKAKNTISEYINYTNRLTGMSSIVKSFNQNVVQAYKEAERLTADGLWTVDQAAAAIKNLTMTNFTLGESVEIIERFKDSAAFGRQGALEFGEAIVGATDGLKNMRSEMVDNVGLTKNLSRILVEMGYSENDLQKVQSDVNVRMALFKGIIKETNPMVGDAAKLADNLGGTLAKIDAGGKKLNRTIGQALAPTIRAIAELMIPIIDDVTEWVEKNPELTAGIIGFGIAITGSLTALTALNFILPAITGGLAALNISFAPFLVGAAIVAGVALLVTKFKDLKKEAEEVKKVGLGEEFNLQKGTISELVSEYETLKNKEKLSREEKERLHEITKDLIDQFPDTVQGINDETGAIELNSEALKTNADLKSNETLAKQFESEINAINKQTFALEERKKLLETELEPQNFDMFKVLTTDKQKSEAVLQLHRILEKAGSELNVKDLFGINHLGEADKLTVEDFIEVNKIPEVKEAIDQFGDSYRKVFGVVIDSYENEQARIQRITEQIKEVDGELVDLAGQKDTYLQLLAKTYDTIAKGGSPEEIQKFAEELQNVIQTISDAEKYSYDGYDPKTLQAMAEGRLQTVEIQKESLSYYQKETEAEKAMRKSMTEGRLLYNKLQQRTIDYYAKETEAEKEKRRLMAEGNAQVVQAVKDRLEQNVRDNTDANELLEQQMQAYREGQIKAASESQRLIAEAEEEARQKANQKYIDKQVAWWTTYQNTINQKNLDAAREGTKGQTTAWQQFLDQMAEKFEDHPLVQIFSNLGWKDTKVGKFFAKGAEKVNKMMGGAFDKIFSGGWVSIIVDLISQTKSFQYAMKMLNSFLQPFLGLIDKILLPLLKMIAKLWNWILDQLSAIDIFGWKPFEDAKKYKIDVETGETADTDKDNKKDQKAQGTQYINFTGKSLDAMRDWLAPLLDIVIQTIYLANIDRNISQILSNLSAGQLSTVGAGAGGTTIMIDKVNNYYDSAPETPKQWGDNLAESFETVTNEMGWK